VVLCVVAGAWIGIAPWLLEHRARVRFAESDRLVDTVQQISRIEEVGERIAGATGQWLTVQERADKTASTAKEIAEGVNREAQQFRAFLERANDQEKSHLRLEVEKLRRSEEDWIEVLVRIMDNVFALHAAAMQSGQARVIEQITAFHQVCRDYCRRRGLTPFAAAQNEPFDGATHQLADSSEPPADGGLVTETLAPGYTYQGQLLRRALVRIQASAIPSEFETEQRVEVEPDVNAPAETAEPAPVIDEAVESAPAEEPKTHQRTLF
jgi:molecular chaperone GrpE (heat shock protein)